MTDGTASRGRMLERALVLLGTLLLIASLLAAYIRFQALDTETVQESATLLIEDDEVRDQVAASLVEQLFANVDVGRNALEEQLPTDQAARGPAERRRARARRPRGGSHARPSQGTGALGERRQFSHEQLITVLEDEASVASRPTRVPSSSISAPH